MEKDEFILINLWKKRLNQRNIPWGGPIEAKFGLFSTEDMQTPPPSPPFSFDLVFMDDAECAE